MNYIGFSLWGDKPIYNIGAIRNVDLCNKIYQGWKVIIYYDNSVPDNTIQELSKLNCVLVDMSKSKIFGCFWRFLCSDLPDCEYAIFRDTDSRVSDREKSAVDEWINSNKSIHIMRDHPAHRIPYGANSLGILAGMWGIKGKIINMRESIENFMTNNTLNRYGVDQTFLMSINEKFKNDNITHDEFFSKKPFPINRKNGRFIGERIDINENPLTEDYKILL